MILPVMTGAATGALLGWILRGDVAVSAKAEAGTKPDTALSAGPGNPAAGTSEPRSGAVDAIANADALQPMLRLLCTADAAAPSDMPRLLLAARNLPGVTPFLSRHWADMDASHMYRVLRDETGSRPLSGDSAVTDALFDAWLAKDKEAALAALDDDDALPDMQRLRSSVVRELLHDEPERGLRQIAKWKLNLHYNDMGGIAEWAARDPAAAAEASAHVPLRGVSEHLLIEVAKVWRNADPVAAMRWAMRHAIDHPDSPAAGKVSHIARLEWGEYKGELANAFADTITDPALRVKLGLDPLPRPESHTAPPLPGR